MTTFRDKSAYTTLDGENMSKEFDIWYLDFLKQKQRTPTFVESFEGRQPEIDALKAQVENYKQYADGVSDQLREANKEVAAFKTELIELRSELIKSGMERLTLMAENERLKAENDEITEKNHELWLEINGAKDFSTTKRRMELDRLNVDR